MWVKEFLMKHSRVTVLAKFVGVSGGLAFFCVIVGMLAMGVDSQCQTSHEGRLLMVLLVIGALWGVSLLAIDQGRYLP